MKLDIAAAERFLTSLPLLSLDRDEARPLTLQRSKSLDQVQKNSSQRVLREDAQRRWVADLPILMPLDVLAAESFLTSLTVGSGEEAVPMSLPELQRLREAIVIGGWRGQADLVRLVPVLLKKGLLGGRLGIMTRQTCAYMCSTRPLGDIPSSGPEMPQVKLPYFPLGGTRWLCCPRRHANTAHIKGTSYAEFLIPTVGSTYDPDFLDDQSLRQGKNHTVLRLEGYHVSIVPFIRARRLKDELNDQFRCSHPQVHPSLTLSKLRNLQKDLREITQQMPDLDVCSVALAWVYFEKLVLKDCVRKASRKLLAGACLVLAFKFHQRGDREKIRRLASEIRKMDRKDRLQWDDLHEAELKVFVWLEFSLHVPAGEVMPHLHRIMKDLGMSWQEIGEAGYPKDAAYARPHDDDAEVSMRDFSAPSFY